MTECSEVEAGGLIFDASPLNYFNAAGQLQVLKELTVPFVAKTTNAVLDELAAGPLGPDIDIDWLEVEPVDHLDELRALLAYVDVLGGGRRHLGEATVLGWAEVHIGSVSEHSTRMTRARSPTCSNTSSTVCAWRSPPSGTPSGTPTTPRCCPSPRP